MKENKMGVVPMKKLLITMSIPMMISMLVQALYNVVDSIFVAQVSENALTAVSLAFPFQNLMISVGVGTGVGVNSLLSRLLGEKKHKEASEAALNGLFLSTCSYIIFAALGICFSRYFFAVQTDVAEIVEGGHQYLLICSLFSFGLFLATMLEKLLSSTGKTMLTMSTQLVGALFNIVLDPILIFGLFGFPAMGVAGAAAATVAGQIASAILGIWLNLRYNHEIHISLRGFHPDFSVIAAIYSVGIPSIIMSSIGSIMTFGMNKILLPFSTTAAAVFGVYFKLQSFVFMPVFGMNNSLIPIVAYNYGAGKPKRVISAWKLALLYAALIMAAGTLIFQLFPATLFRLFNPSQEMLSLGVPALRIISVHFILASFGIITSATFQALGHGMYSLWASLIRQLVVLLPVAWLMSKTGNIDLVWLAFPISEVVSASFCAVCMHKVWKTQIQTLPDLETLPA